MFHIHKDSFGQTSPILAYTAGVRGILRDRKNLIAVEANKN